MSRWAALRALAGLAKQTLSSIEAGKANPTVLTLSAVADGLGVPVAHLPHLAAPLTQEAVVHMVTTVPHVSQIGGRPG